MCGFGFTGAYSRDFGRAGCIETVGFGIQRRHWVRYEAVLTGRSGASRRVFELVVLPGLIGMINGNSSARGGGVFFLCKLPVLAIGLFGLAGLFLHGGILLQGGAAGIAQLQVLDALGEDAAGNLAVLRAGAGFLALDDDAGGQVLQLDGRARLVDLLAARAGALEEGFGNVSLDDGGAWRQRFGAEWAGGCGEGPPWDRFGGGGSGRWAAESIGTGEDKGHGQLEESWEETRPHEARPDRNGDG